MAWSMKKKQERTIEENILLLQKKSSNSSISIKEIINTLEGRWQALLLLFLSIPFCQPLQIPGFSTPFGLLIAFIGLKIAFGKYAWLPEKIIAKEISASTVQKITDHLLWLLKKMHTWIYPRLTWMYQYQVMQVLNGLTIFFLGILLALPLPIPFSNLMAAWPIFFIGLGLLEDDGACIIIGYLLSFLALAFFAGIVLLIYKGIVTL